MDSIKLEQLITENMKSIFGFALTRLGTVAEAEWLASDILYEIVRSAPNLKDEEQFYGFMWKIAENVYMDYLRKKTKNASRTTELVENTADESKSVLDEIVKNEELNLLRRKLSLLSKQYREATGLYYIENLSCSEAANKLQISAEMVKYYLFRARKIIREGMNMERLYGEKSCRPNIFEIDFWGTKAGDDREYRDFQRRKIKGNILLAAYYSPVTIQEISIELGVALPYLEDEIKLLVDRQYLVCNNGKYLTNIPIFTPDCTKTIDGKLKELTEESARKFIAVNYLNSEISAVTVDSSIIERVKLLYDSVGAKIEKGAFKEALEDIFESIHFSNTYYDAKQPWKTRVDNIDERKATIAVCTYLIANIANLLHPFLPFSSQKVSDWLGTTLKWEEQSVSVQRIPSDISILFSKVE